MCAPRTVETVCRCTCVYLCVHESTVKSHLHLRSHILSRSIQIHILGMAESRDVREITVIKLDDRRGRHWRPHTHRLHTGHMRACNHGTMLPVARGGRAERVAECAEPIGHT